ncbi:hypothetical protein MICRO116_260019 [Micrococcus sp. 116]|nr:hypothetical protein MICRO116_260019 [Micrococcus sp. 116]
MSRTWPAPETCRRCTSDRPIPEPRLGVLRPRADDRRGGHPLHGRLVLHPRRHPRPAGRARPLHHAPGRHLRQPCRLPGHELHREPHPAHPVRHPHRRPAAADHRGARHRHRQHRRGVLHDLGVHVRHRPHRGAEPRLAGPRRDRGRPRDGRLPHADRARRGAARGPRPADPRLHVRDHLARGHVRDGGHHRRRRRRQLRHRGGLQPVPSGGHLAGRDRGDRVRPGAAADRQRHRPQGHAPLNPGSVRTTTAGDIPAGTSPAVVVLADFGP